MNLYDYHKNPSELRKYEEFHHTIKVFKVEVGTIRDYGFSHTLDRPNNRNMVDRESGITILKGWELWEGEYDWDDTEYSFMARGTYMQIKKFIDLEFPETTYLKITPQ